MAEPMTVHPQITDAVAAPAPRTSHASLGFGFVSDEAMLSLAWDALDQEARFEIELPVELDVPVCTPGGIIVPVCAQRSFELDGELALALAEWMAATLPGCEIGERGEGDEDGEGEGPKHGALRYSVADDCVELVFCHDRATGQLRCRVVLDELPAELPLPNPWSPCKVSLTIRHRLPFPSLASASALAEWIGAQLA